MSLDICPEEIIFKFLEHLDDESIIKCSGVNKQLVVLAKDNNVWSVRLKSKFPLVISTDDNFSKYVQCDIDKFYHNNLILNINSHIYYPGAIFSFLMSMDLVTLTRSIIYEPLTLALKSGSFKHYTIESGIRYMRDLEHEYWIRFDTREKLTVQQLEQQIINFRKFNGYYLTHRGIGTVIGEKLLRNNLAVLFTPGSNIIE